MSVPQERSELLTRRGLPPADQPVAEASQRATEVRTRHLFTREEVLGNPELETSVQILTVAGDTYTGKTGLAERLVKRLKFGKANTFLVGQRMREAEKAGQGAQGFIARDPSVDVAFDLLQDDMILHATAHKPILLESRLAALKAKQERPQDSVSVLLLASIDERKRRAVNRTTDSLNARIKALEKLSRGEKDPLIVRGNEFAIASLREQLRKLDPDEVWEMEEGRDTGDEDRYRDLYPWFAAIEGDYMDPELTIDGKPVYDIIIVTDGHNPEEVYDLTCEAIAEFRKNREGIRTIIGTLGGSKNFYVIGHKPND